MAVQYASSSALVVLISLVLTPLLSEAAITLNGVRAIGTLCCTPTGTCVPSAAPLVGAAVTLNCTNPISGAFSVGNGITNVNGAFNITIPLATTLLTPITSLACSVTSLLPINNTVCPVLNTATGVLTGTLNFVGITVSTIFGLLGTLLNIVVIAFTVTAG